jgi:hypothetical protein
MAVITITITESPVQKIAGIPVTVSLSTNIPSTIFYTLDGTVPTVLSTIYISPIEMPSNVAQVILQVFATNGVDSSSIVSQTFGTSIIGDRFPHATVDVNTQGFNTKDLFPFGEMSPSPDVRYGNVGGVIVSDPAVAGIPDSYDGTATGTFADKTDKPYKLHDYEVIYSDRNDEGIPGKGIGTLPATVTIRVPPAPPESTEIESPLFNHNALVIYQDGTVEPFDPNITHVNKQFFSLENPETAKDGAFFRTTGIEGANVTGSLLKYYYNSRDDTYTFYYRDTESNRWIISKEPNRVPTNVNALRNIVMPSSGREGDKVFRWIEFKGSRLI